MTFSRTKRACDRRLDHVGRRPRIPGLLPDAPGPHRPAFFGRSAEPLLHVLGRLSLADTVDQGRLRHAAPGQPFAPERRLRSRARRRSPRAGVPVRRPTTRAWRRRHDGARPSRSSTSAAPARRVTGPRSHATRLQSDTRTGHRRSRPPARPRLSGGRRGRSFRAHGRTAPGRGSSRACPSGRRSA